MDDVSNQSRQSFQSVNRRRDKARRAGVGVILADRRHLSNLETESRRLDEHLRVKHEVVAVLQERNRLQKSARVSPVPGVIFGEVQTENAILRSVQEPAAKPLPPGHYRLGRHEA